MAATTTVPRRPTSRVSRAPQAPKNITEFPIIPRHGVVTLWGYGINVSVDRGHLILRDGIGDERRFGRFPRVGHGIRRLIIVGIDGFLSLASMEWLADQHVTFVMLDRDGSVRLTTGPVSASDARLRRAQANTAQTDGAAMIARELIDRKLAAQEKIARETLNDAPIARAVAAFRGQLKAASEATAIRTIEAQGSYSYWSAWRNLAVEFPRRDINRVPEHWRVFGTRQSPLTGSPRNAVNPANALLNYLYAMLESETRLAAAAMGLDPGLGVLHVDYRNRDSLACDLMEPVRPKVDAYLFDLLRRSTLKREWFFERGDGNCRLTASILATLSETALTWRREIAPVVEWFAETVASLGSDSARYRGPGTRLTQRRWRESIGYVEPAPKSAPKVRAGCKICGNPVSLNRDYCVGCIPAQATEQIKKVNAAGRLAARTPHARKKLGERQREQNVARKAWSPADLPEWLTQETYLSTVQPKLANLTRSTIATALNVSIKYAGDVRSGFSVPHPRHWTTLSELVRVNSL